MSCSSKVSEQLTVAVATFLLIITIIVLLLLIIAELWDCVRKP